MVYSSSLRELGSNFRKEEQVVSLVEIQHIKQEGPSTLCVDNKSYIEAN